MNSNSHRTRTLWLCGMLHAFTHIYHVALLPLYLLIQKDLGLESVERATLLVTVMMLSYFVPSYPMGMLADRFSRKKLLAIGLIINALGFIGLAFSGSYPVAVCCVAVAGLGGSFFHPTATALIARLFPVGTGKALGLLGIGASVGFFFSPIYSGWRATVSGSWRTPVLELGILGIVAALLFLWLAEDHTSTPSNHSVTTKTVPAKMFATTNLWLFFIGASFAFSLRDFTGSSMGSLGSLFLQKAHGLDLKFTGFALSSIFVVASISNPLFGGLSDRGRIRWTSLVLIIAATMVFVFPHVPKIALIPTLAIYGFFFMASYPMIEAALMESVHDSVRGRVFGFFITIGGLVGNLAHWAAGSWVKSLGPGAYSVANYYPIYTVLALLILLSLLGMPCLHAIRKREGETSPPLSIPLENTKKAGSA